MIQLTRERTAAEIAAEEELPAAAQMLAAIVGTFKATREADWRQLCRSPLANGVDDLTSKHGPFALEPAQARYVRGLIERFGKLFPEAFDQLRLCALGHGIDVIVGMLATADNVSAREEGGDEAGPGAPVRRYFADELQEVVRAYRPVVKWDRRWVV